MTATKPPTVTQKVERFLKRHNMAGKSLLVAVSGGADSVCLLHVLASLRQKFGIKLHVAHLDHQLRGKEAEADAEYVAQLADHLGLEATIEKRDVAAYKAEKRLSLEEAAREVRYGFLAETAAQTGAGAVVTGHTADDHVETILMHIIRGSGTKGLRGLEPSVSWTLPAGKLTVVRPLLKVSRRETVGYCRHHRLEPRIDATNLELAPLRNRIRLELLPLLRGYNSRLDDAVTRLAELATEDQAFIEAETKRLWPDVAEKQGNTCALNKEKISNLPLALKRKILRLAVESILGNLKDIEARHIEQMVKALGKPAGRRIILPCGLIFTVEYDRFLLSTEEGALSPLPVLEGEYNLNVPCKTDISGWHVTAEIISPKETVVSDDKYTAMLDYDLTGGKLTVRSRRRGDRFQPLGLASPKRLAVFMIDARIPHAWRDNIPLVCSAEGQILWLAGWRIDERFKVTDNTKRVLCLKFERR